MKNWIPIAFLAFTTSSTYADPMMVVKGQSLVDLSFEKEADVSKQNIGLRKETKVKLVDGDLFAMPPVVAYEGQNKTSKWAKSNMARIHFPNMPKEYVAEFKWLHKKASGKKFKLYIDVGHRCIRTTFGQDGTTLLLENHLVGKSEKVTSKVLDQNKELKLEDDKWYDITVEVKGDEVLVQIDDFKLYGKDPLISKNKATSFNLDSSGAGFLVDHMQIHSAASKQSNWNETIKSL